MENTLNKLIENYPGLTFKPSQQFSWAPEKREISYIKGSSGQKSVWSLLHETGHALLEHDQYQADYQLIRLEVAAWEEAKRLATLVGVSIKEDHIQDCLDTYRDWLYKRSICPTCHTKSLQQNDFVHYRCFNCSTAWRVTPSRFCRSYRSTKNVRQPIVFRLLK